MNNLFISYDLYKPDRDYTDLFNRIKSLGTWAHVKLTLWYVKTNVSVIDARDQVWDKMQPQDKLIVIDASTNRGAWCGIGDEVSNFLQTNWN